MKNRNYTNGFTIVELLVVIVVIGVLATITTVSFVGISRKAVVASIKSDLSNFSIQLKIFSAEKNEFPSDNICPTTDSTEICLKSSPGNVIDYTRLTAQSYYLKITNGSNIWFITESSQPSEEMPLPPIFAGGTVANGVITHTFGPGTSTITSTRNGTIAVDIKGGGGGEGAEYSNKGTNGSPSSIKIDSGTPYLANGGTGSDPWEDGESGFYPGNPGTTSPNGLTGVDGGAANSSGDTCSYPGGPGGRVYGNINVLSGQSLLITVGAGGTGAFYDNYYCEGSNGGSGSVTISYPE